jgi:hypothetical protein
VIHLKPAEGRAGNRALHAVVGEIYRGHPQHRNTEVDVVEMLIGGRSVYHRHATVRPHLLLDGERVVGRALLVHDRNLHDHVQVGYFEALPGLVGVKEALVARARELFPGVSRLVCGLGGHLNYNAGILVEGFAEPPVFGLNWNPPYYAAYFDGMRRRSMASYRFDVRPFCAFAGRLAAELRPGKVTIRTMQRRHLRRDARIYTELNNACFQRHPYWSDRTPEEDFELLHPFRFLLGEENLIFAEVDGEPVGFLLWYPDFNQLVSRPGDELGLRHVLRYRLRNPIRAVRLTEVAVRREHRLGSALGAMILQMIRSVRRGPYDTCEGGFIFEENDASIGMTLGLLKHAIGRELQPFRRWAVFDEELGS